MGALPNFTGKRVLLVEDNEINQMIALAMLEQVGVQVSVAANGLEGVEAASWHDFDLVLMDIQMPVMGGLEATRRIRELPNGRAKVPIVAMTAHAMSGDYDKSLASGMDDHITKPIAPEVLFAALGRWVPLG